MFKSLSGSTGSRTTLWVMATLMAWLLFLLYEGGFAGLLEAINDLF
jgi:hypothetical protein